MSNPTSSRRATTPQEIYGIFTDFLAAQDLDGLLTLYEPEAAMINGPGQVVAGEAAIRESLAPFLAMEAKLNFEPAQIAQVGDLALAHAKWTATGKSPEGPIEMAGVTSEIIRRQTDGRWLFVVDDPGFGVTAP